MQKSWTHQSCMDPSEKEKLEKNLWKDYQEFQVLMPPAEIIFFKNIIKLCFLITLLIMFLIDLISTPCPALVNSAPFSKEEPLSLSLTHPSRSILWYSSQVCCLWLHIFKFHTSQRSIRRLLQKIEIQFS